MLQVYKVLYDLLHDRTVYSNLTIYRGLLDRLESLGGRGGHQIKRSLALTDDWVTFRIAMRPIQTTVRQPPSGSTAPPHHPVRKKRCKSDDDTIVRDCSVSQETTRTSTFRPESAFESTAQRTPTPQDVQRYYTVREIT